MILQISMCRRGRTDLANRTFTRELLETAAPEAAARNLREIARINRWFGGHAALIRMMRHSAHSQERFSVLDVGAGSGDMGRCLVRHFPNAQVISLDHRTAHLRNAASPRVVADALRLPFRSQAFDFVLCSSVLHHFRDHEVIEMIAALRPFARRALLLLDLERHPLAYWFIPLTRRLLKWSELTVHDGTVSVASAFRLEELVSLACDAGASEIAARQHRPWFRISVTIPANAPESHSAGSPHEERRGQIATKQALDAARVQSISPAEKMVDPERVTCRKEAVGGSVSHTETKMEVGLLSRSNAPGSADVKHLA
jgi:SAM-dependent methyltransferase